METVETISVEQTRKVLNDLALGHLVIKVASRNPHISQYVGSSVDGPLSLRAAREYGILWMSVWFLPPQGQPKSFIGPNPIELATPIGDIHHVKLLQLQIAEGATRIHRTSGDSIVGMRLGISRGDLYFQDKKHKDRKCSVQEGSEVYALLRGPNLRVNFP